MYNNTMANSAAVALGIIIVLVLAVAASRRPPRRRLAKRVNRISPLPEGASVGIACPSGKRILINTAYYEINAEEPLVEVGEALQAIFDKLAPGERYTVNGAALGQRGGGRLGFTYTCEVAREGFRPVPVSPCGPSYDGEYGVDMTNTFDLSNTEGTVAWLPYSTESRISLERGAEGSSVTAPVNPVVGIGKGSTVRRLGDRYGGYDRPYTKSQRARTEKQNPRTDALRSLSEFELQPAEAGYVERVNDGALSLLASVSRRSPPAASPASGAAPVQEIDSEFATDGPYGAAAIKEAMTSSRTPVWNPYTARRVGLGSVRLDPRFEPGPETRVASGDNSPSPGSHAGGISLGALGSPKFQTNGGWPGNYVHGFGAAEYGRQEAILTEKSMW